jgi:hypothetical protein
MLQNKANQRIGQNLTDFNDRKQIYQGRATSIESFYQHKQLDLDTVISIVLDLMNRNNWIKVQFPPHSRFNQQKHLDQGTDVSTESRFNQQRQLDQGTVISTVLDLFNRNNWINELLST